MVLNRGVLLVHCFGISLKVREGQPCIARMKNELMYNRVVDYTNENVNYNIKSDDKTIGINLHLV